MLATWVKTHYSYHLYPGDRPIVRIFLHGVKVSHVILVSYTAFFSLVTQRSSPHGVWGGALRDETKNGCVAD